MKSEELKEALLNAVATICEEYAKDNKPTWICNQCQEEQTSEVACTSKYTNGSYCCAYCADVSDLNQMLKDK